MSLPREKQSRQDLPGEEQSRQTAQEEARHRPAVEEESQGSKASSEERQGLPRRISAAAGTEAPLEAVKMRNAPEGTSDFPQRDSRPISPLTQTLPLGRESVLIYYAERLAHSQGEAPLLSEIWKQAAPEEKQRLLRRIPQAVERAAKIYSEENKGTDSREKTREYRQLQKAVEEIWRQAEQMGQPNPQQRTAWQQAAHIQQEMASPPLLHRLPAPQYEAVSEYAADFSPAPPLGAQNGGPFDRRAAAAEGSKNTDSVFHASGMAELTLQYPELGTSGIVYAVKAPDSPEASKKQDHSQAVQELESRITRQEYIIRQDRIEMEELQQRLKKQEIQTKELQNQEHVRVRSRQGSHLPQKVIDQLKDQLRLDRIRYGAD